jgi:UDP-N-acetylglucosamine 4-epimerase
MSSALELFEETKTWLRSSPRTWVVTGAAGFIGSHLVETLLQCRQRVIGLDNLSTGHARNLAHVQSAVGPALWKNFTWMEEDIRDPNACQRAAQGSDYVLHQAAMGSVPRSLANPTETHASNVTGFVNMLWAAREAKVKRFVFASSSAVYGDIATLPQVEEHIGNCLSPYAVSKRTNELYADVFARCYGMEYIGLRYFNVFGPRQDPDGSYAAVIPKWIGAMIGNKPVCLDGDGSTSRDFCYVANVVQANLLAATIKDTKAVNRVYNIALGDETTLSVLFETLREWLLPACPHLQELKPTGRPFRAGDVRHSRADISQARQFLGYHPTHPIRAGLKETVNWYVNNLIPNPHLHPSPVLL